MPVTGEGLCFFIVETRPWSAQIADEGRRSKKGYFRPSIGQKHPSKYRRLYLTFYHSYDALSHCDALAQNDVRVQDGVQPFLFLPLLHGALHVYDAPGEDDVLCADAFLFYFYCRLP